MILNEENYYTEESNKNYMSNSQFKRFLACEESAMEEQTGTNDAFLFGGYVDAYFTDDVKIYKELHPEMFKKDGTLYAKFEKCDDCINALERQPLAMKYLNGEKQVIMTGEIEGVPFKIKIDSYHKGKAIVDLKTCKDFCKVWKDGEYKNFVDAYGYDIQGAIYQEIVRQNTGETLPFFIVAVTKETTPDVAVLSIPQDVLDSALMKVKALAPLFNEIKQGKREARRCEKCDHCKATKVLNEIIDYRRI